MERSNSANRCKAHLLVHGFASEHHPPEQGLNVAELRICACRALQRLLYAGVQVQSIRLHQGKTLVT